jgi:hypothetical protein
VPVGVSFFAKSTQAADPAKKAEALLASAKAQMERTKGEPIDARKKLFKEFQRDLHPDKNPDCPEAAKLAFQQLMDSRGSYLTD